MSLVIPTVGGDFSPNYAIEINQSLTTIDSHNHTPGSGVLITPQAININTALTFANNLASNLQGVNFFLQGTAPTTGKTLYVKNGTEGTPLPDLWYYDGSNQIQITSGGTLASVPTTVAGLSYAGGTFSFVQGAGSTTPAGLSSGPVSISPQTAGAASVEAVVVNPPSTISSIYDLYLPLIPSSTSFLTIDTSGNITGSVSTSGGITGANIGPGQITSANIANSTITAFQIAANTIVEGNIVPGTITTASISPTAGITVGQLAGVTVAGTSISSFSTSSTSFVGAATFSITSVGRPIDIVFRGTSGTVGASRIQASGTTNPTIYFLVLNNTTGSVINSGMAEINQVANGFVLSMPASMMNCIDYTSPAGLNTYELFLAANSGCTVTIANVIMEGLVR